MSSKFCFVIVLVLLLIVPESSPARSSETHSEPQQSETIDSETKSKTKLIPFMIEERHMSGEIIEGWTEFSKNIYRPEFLSLKGMLDLAAEQTFGSRYYYKSNLISAKFQYSTIKNGQVGLFIESSVSWLENSATCYIYSQYDDKTHSWLFNNYECNK